MMFRRMTAVLMMLQVICFAGTSSATETLASSANSPIVASYEVRIVGREPRRLGVKARLPISGQDLEMASSFPGDVPELLQRGWPALVKKLTILDQHGKRLEFEPNSDSGWRLMHPRSGWIDLTYEVDYSVFETRQWPALREAAYGNADTIAVIGRSLFVSTPATGPIEVAFKLPPGWQPITAWLGGHRKFSVSSVADLTENLLVLSRSRPTTVQASGFRVSVVTLGHWRKVDAHVASTLQPLLERFVKLMAFGGQHQYLVVLLPGDEKGGEAFRSSFAMTAADEPTLDNRHKWGSVIGHEIFHYWNGWRLRGENYAATQWFQEGFTEYVAIRTMLSSRLMSPDQFLENLSAKVNAYRSLQTPMDAPGNRKGPPLYSAGALVAFSWDIKIREHSANQKSLDQFLQALWLRTEQGILRYRAEHILAALDETSPGDWKRFLQEHISAQQPLPLSASFAQVGLRIVESDDGKATVELDPSASPEARARWHAFTADR